MKTTRSWMLATWPSLLVRPASTLRGRLGPAVERGQQVVPDAADVQLVELPAAAGRHQGHQPVVGQADFLAGVEVEVVGDGLDPGFRPAGGLVQQVVGGDQVVVDGVAQVGQIEAAERAVPVAAIALAAVELDAGLLDQLGIDRVAGPAADLLQRGG